MDTALKFILYLYYSSIIMLKVPKEKLSLFRSEIYKRDFLGLRSLLFSLLNNITGIVLKKSFLLVYVFFAF